YNWLRRSIDVPGTTERWNTASDCHTSSPMLATNAHTRVYSSRALRIPINRRNVNSRTDAYVVRRYFAAPPKLIPKGTDRHASIASAATTWGGHVRNTAFKVTRPGANTAHVSASTNNTRTGRTRAIAGK